MEGDDGRGRGGFEDPEGDPLDLYGDIAGGQGDSGGGGMVDAAGAVGIATLREELQAERWRDAGTGGSGARVVAGVDARVR